MDTTVWIIIAVVAVLLVLAVLAFAGRSRRNKQLHGKAERIREEVEQDSLQVRRREALADETAAKARAAQAEAEAKAAEARRLADRADLHRDAVATSQEELDERRAHADSLDPRVKSKDQPVGDEAQAVPQPVQQQQPPPATHPR
jgi:predicted Holliday junction resolvase-like endonuclease